MHDSLANAPPTNARLLNKKVRKPFVNDADKAAESEDGGGKAGDTSSPLDDASESSHGPAKSSKQSHGWAGAKDILDYFVLRALPVPCADMPVSHSPAPHPLCRGAVPPRPACRACCACTWPMCVASRTTSGRSSARASGLAGDGGRGRCRAWRAALAAAVVVCLGRRCSWTAERRITGRQVHSRAAPPSRTPTHGSSVAHMPASGASRQVTCARDTPAPRAGTNPERAKHIHSSMKLPIIGDLTLAEGVALGAFTTSGDTCEAVPDLDLGIHGIMLENGPPPARAARAARAPRSACCTPRRSSVGYAVVRATPRSQHSRMHEPKGGFHLHAFVILHSAAQQHERAEFTAASAQSARGHAARALRDRPRCRSRSRGWLRGPRRG